MQVFDAAFLVHLELLVSVLLYAIEFDGAWIMNTTVTNIALYDF